MIKIGLTGGVGMGKSTVGSFFEGLGLPVIDTDLIARQIVEPGQIALHEIVAAFGSSILFPDGSLDRSALAKVVFEDPQRRKTLESILHPRIRNRWLEAVRGWDESQLPAGVVIIPLLYETNAAADFDYVVCVCCGKETQFERLSRRGWRLSDIQGRLSAQWPATKKADLADYFVWTDVSMEWVESQVRGVLAVVLGERWKTVGF